MKPNDIKIHKTGVKVLILEEMYELTQKSKEWVQAHFWENTTASFSSDALSYYMTGYKVRFPSGRVEIININELK